MAEALTPMMRQYQRIKSEVAADILLMFRLGDFYEMFYEDAQIAAPILGVALTKRAGYPMCGVPYHAVDVYLAKLVRAGKKIAICDQMEDPALAKGIVRREITRIVTPGSITEENILSDEKNNYLVAVAVGPFDKNKADASKLAIAAIDISTGELFAEEAESFAEGVSIIRRLAPGEGIVPRQSIDAEESYSELLLKEAGVGCITPVEEWFFDEASAYGAVIRHFAVRSLEGFGCEGKPLVAAAAGALLQHVRDNLRRDLSHVKNLRLNLSAGYMQLDEATCSHLDLIPQNGKTSAETLFGVLNTTCTPMGTRLLSRWIVRPLHDVEAINARQSAVAAIIGARNNLTPLRAALSEVRDLERIIARISLGRGNARDLQAVANALRVVPELRSRLEGSVAQSSSLIASLLNDLQPLPELTEEIDKTIVETPPTTLVEGGVIREGVDAELDELRNAAANGRAWIANYQASEIAKTGIKTLKVRYNKVFGYFIEVSIGQIGNVPEHYMRKQTMTNCERYTTTELKDVEEKITGAAERAITKEEEIFLALRDKVVSFTTQIQAIAVAIANIDVLAALADRALALGYIRPQILEDDTLRIIGGRHPVIEQLPDTERFVPNDVELNCDSRQIMIITGPNMAGKSTYIRQVAVLVIMAQIGSYIPADVADIGVVDRVFTRVGASDDLVRGRSTFMVEMQETANILNNATPRSLIVLDEIGRGTSTFDGISIAWAVAEYLHNTPSVKAKTLFATHYHELTDLANTLDGVVNCSVLVSENPNGIVFLRKIINGPADKSYGIAVAKLAGMPEGVIGRAKDILTTLEADDSDSNASANNGDANPLAFAETRAKAKKAREVFEDKNMLLFDGF
ncbi:MAG: DNA mismatch repair protein MutS [Kiritimatiellae bacterium]|nr:DNA mismatch repair protein MutS [Kiritimatiellia bacterium]